MDALPVLQASGSRSSARSSGGLAAALAAIGGALAVGLGAFGAHGLEEHLLKVDRLKMWETAAFYHLIHALLALYAAQSGRSLSSWILLAGILLFSGSLYCFSFFIDHAWLGWLTPVGGLAFLLGWLSFLLPKRSLR